MSTPVSSLPESWVRRIFATMRATYGAAFDRQWECPAGADPAEHAQGMVEHWARELRGYQQNPQAISYALENLPEHPPNLIEFRALCRSRPDAMLPQLPAPKPDPERVRSALASITKPGEQSDPKQWARDLEAREKGGERLTLAQQIAWREALHDDSANDAVLFSAIREITDDVLPPGMRKQPLAASASFDNAQAAANAEAAALAWEARA